MTPSPGEVWVHRDNPYRVEVVQVLGPEPPVHRLTWWGAMRSVPWSEKNPAPPHADSDRVIVRGLSHLVDHETTYRLDHFMEVFEPEASRSLAGENLAKALPS